MTSVQFQKTFFCENNLHSVADNIKKKKNFIAFMQSQNLILHANHVGLAEFHTAE